ncbi:MAG: hypothetical protein WCB76_04150, partial [Acidobacteriaceae bacterium]
AHSRSKQSMPPRNRSFGSFAMLAAERSRATVAAEKQPQILPLRLPRPRSCADREPLLLRLETVRHPASKELDAILRPGAFSSWRGRRHDSAADTANAVVDGCGMRLHIIVAGKVERLTHCPNISLCEEWANVGLIARQFCHGPQPPGGAFEIDFSG